MYSKKLTRETNECYKISCSIATCFYPPMDKACDHIVKLESPSFCVVQVFTISNEFFWFYFS